jgi:CO/xanthine dehydrogenase FAD-binding subunit
VEQQLLNQKWNAQLIDEACVLACHELEISEDMLLSVADKQQLCRAYMRRTLLRAAELAQSGSFQSR